MVEPAPDPVEPPRATPHRALRIVVALGDPDSALALALFLTVRDHEVSVCHDGASLVGLTKWFAPDACIVDTRLGKLDSGKAARTIRASMRPVPYLLALVDDDAPEASCEPFDARLPRSTHPIRIAEAVEAAIRSM